MTLRKGWEVKKLGEVCDVRDGTHDSPQFLDMGYPLVTAKNLTPFGLNLSNVKYISEQDFENINKRSKVEINDILFAMIGTIGNPVLITEQPNFAIKNVALLKRKEANQNMLFYKYYLMSPNAIELLESSSKGVAQKFVSLKVLRGFEIPIPPFAEQQRIVEILDEAFAGIDTAIANTERAIANCKELFDSELNRIFSQRGEGWEVKALGDITFVASGGTPSRQNPTFWQGNIPWYSSGELNNELTSEPNEFITEFGLSNSNAKLFPKGSLLIGMYDTAALKMSITDRAATFNQAISAVEPQENINSLFLLYSIVHQKDYLLNQRRGVRQKNLNLSKIKEIKIALPSLEMQNLVVKKLQDIQDQTQALEAVYQQKLAALQELKQSLLHKAFTGELTAHWRSEH